MDKLKRFIDCYIPTETCNLRCHYCYVTQRRMFNNKLVHFDYSPEYIRKALSKKRLGGCCLLNMCAGGETLLSEEVLDVIKELLREGHYVMVVTNGTITKRFEQIALWNSELLHHLFFKFSFHYLELTRLKLLDIFFDNVHRVHEAGCSFTVEIMPNDELIPCIEDVKKICMEKVGALPHVTVARDEKTREFKVLTNLSWEKYCKIWGEFNSSMFDFKSEVFGQKRTEFCYAGDWSTTLNLKSGELRQCTYEPVLCNIYDDINAPIQFRAIGKHCSMAHCYNSHVYMTLGCIPSLETPTFADIRNRITIDGEWLQPEFKEFISQKLKDNNIPYSMGEKISIEISSIRGRLVAIPGLRELYRTIMRKDKKQ